MMKTKPVKSNIRKVTGTLYNFTMATALVVLHWSTTAILNLLNGFWNWWNSSSLAAKFTAKSAPKSANRPAARSAFSSTTSPVLKDQSRPGLNSETKQSTGAHTIDQDQGSPEVPVSSGNSQR